MNTPIRIGIVGYGNLGRGVETAIGLNPDMTLVGVFTRRDPASVETVGDQTSVFPMADLDRDRDDIDVLILCGGSRSDLPEQSPAQAARYSIVDSYDNHARIPEHFAAVDAAAKAAGTTAIISTGWDPGLFSLNRVFGEAIVPQGNTYTFWGRGLSQGHSDAVRRVPGVAAGVQYTLPSEPAIERVRAGENPELSTRERHTRECFVVLEDGADADAVRTAIVTMPDYFEPYDTTVNFISAEELARDHRGMPHGGFVIRSGTTSQGAKQVIEYSLTLDSNPEFTASVLVAYARAAARMNQSGQVGAKTVYDVAPGLLSPLSAEELRAGYL
ncbi:diaminopimelate dehydrogenase [Gordonia sp. (in: high G+C Gram-positive bacteria)]|uniref:diaminopimelate dehydrogenase n=1 Tax=Gordonia sp. (in: high G+C Gram-positive bacteria) TaxID=84139 RepID=UPI003C750235